jgi:drug/metabolite transporter (DMT)-like permease
MSLGNWLLLGILSLLWGCSFFFVGVAVSSLPALTIVLLRVGMAALVLWVVVLMLAIPRPNTFKAWLVLLIMGALNNALPFSLIVWGQTHIESGLASILNATTPLFGVLLAGLLLDDERLTRLKVTGVLIGFAGAVWMIGPAALKGLGVNVLAQLAIVGAAISYGFAGVFGRRFKRMGIQPVMAATGQVTMSTLVLFPFVFIIDQPFSLPMPAATVWAAIIALAVFSTALAYILYFRILATAGASNLLLVTFLVPVSAILLGYLILHERLTSSHFIGMALIGLGLSAIDGRLWQRMQAWIK